MTVYDQNNIFAKILRNEISCNKIFENEYAIAFYDINPRAKKHALVIPKGSYVCFSDFSKKATDVEVVGFFKAVQQVTEILGISESGYKIESNNGKDGRQEIDHFHIHIMSGF